MGIMSYSEKELHQALIKLSTLVTTKMIGSINPSLGDSDFLAQLRAYMHKVFPNNSKEQNTRTNIQLQLRSFLKKGKPWEKMETPIPYVSVIKVPIKKQKIAALNLVVSHMKREIDVKNSQAFQKLRDIFDDVRTNSLIKEIDRVNKMRIRINS